MKICTIVGARPQFIKAAMGSRAIREHNKLITDHGSPITEVIIHTGQHYDYQMSQVFFDQLEIPEPHYHLEVGSGTHGDQTGRMLASIETVLINEKPDAVLVYGDTNSTLAGALVAAKLHIPVGHVEGGMRSFNRRMPEEINRVLTDHIAKWHFCATETAVENLKNEGLTKGVHLVGDVMYDAVMLYKDVAAKRSEILERLKLGSQANPVGQPLTNHDSQIAKYALATIHRAENTDDSARLKNILEALTEISKEMRVVLPLHPRTLKAIKSISSPLAGEGDNLLCLAGITIIEPVSYLDMIQLEQHASIILTDSGGMQKEACWLGIPCVTMRDETEWVETVETGMNKIVGADKNNILSAARELVASKLHNKSACFQKKNGMVGTMILNCLSTESCLS